MKKMLEGKKAKMLSPIEKKAKMGVLEKLKADMQDMMGEKVAGLKKVTVASSDKKGLEEGLKKAKEMIHGGDRPDSYLPLNEEGLPEDEEGKEDLEHAEEQIGMDLDGDEEKDESHEHKEAVLGEDEEESEEELDKRIQELLKKKELKKK